MESMWFKCKTARERKLSIPPSCPFHLSQYKDVLLGDDAFALSMHIMKPFPQRDLTEEKRSYNYRHSRARRLFENLFGILANHRW